MLKLPYLRSQRMSATGTITMSMREIDRLKTIQAVIDRNLRPMTAANRLQLSRRQVDRLVARYRLDRLNVLIRVGGRAIA